MQKYKFIILGAGPAGLSFANRLKEKGEESFLLLEKESEAGGLCRSRIVDGSPLDIGGGHFLDVKYKEVNEFLFDFMPEDEWNIFERDSRILVNGRYIHHPFEANIWEFDENSQKEYLKSISLAGCNCGSQKPDKFVDWIRWKLGDKIADDYMLPYNRKMFGNNLDELGTYWLEKLPNVSFDDTLKSCEMKAPYGSQPGHVRFYYPKKYGYGELWNRMAKSIEGNISYNQNVCLLDLDEKLVKTDKGNIFKADIIINTVPWNSFDHINGMPENILSSIKELKHTSVQIEYFDNNIDLPCHWLYLPDEKLSYHRILLRNNFSENSRGYWTETNLANLENCVNTDGGFKYINEYAYPLNTINKPSIMKHLLEYCRTKSIYGLGRWGEHQHYNSDLTVKLALELADSFI